MATLLEAHVKEITVDLYRAEYSGFYLEVPLVRLQIILTNDRIVRTGQRAGWKVDGVDVIDGHEWMPARLREGRTRFLPILTEAIERQIGEPLVQPISAKAFDL